MQLAGKVVVVTGAGSGIGQQLVNDLLRRKARVAAVDLRAMDPKADVLALQCNVAERAAVEALPARVVEHFGAVDGVINCAGIIQPFVPLVELDYATIDRVFDVNFRGTLYMTKAFLPLLLQRPEAHLCNVSSMGGFCPFPGQTIYGASKAAVKLMSEGLRAELLDTPVRVTVVFPGAVNTSIAANSGVKMKTVEAPPGMTTSPQAAARGILDGIERDAFLMIVGKDAQLLDKLYRLAPARAAAFIARRMKAML